MCELAKVESDKWLISANSEVFGISFLYGMVVLFLFIYSANFPLYVFQFCSAFFVSFFLICSHQVTKIKCCSHGIH